jgi:hypothetical protein
MAEINGIPDTTLDRFNRMAIELTHMHYKLLDIARCNKKGCVHLLEEGLCKSCHCQYAQSRTVCFACYCSGLCTAETRRNATCKHRRKHIIRINTLTKLYNNVLEHIDIVRKQTVREAFLHEYNKFLILRNIYINMYLSTYGLFAYRKISKWNMFMTRYD